MDANLLSPRRIYCVHGKPSSGCCKVLEGELIEIGHTDLDITNLAKENLDATNLRSYIKLFQI